VRRVFELNFGGTYSLCTARKNVWRGHQEYFIEKHPVNLRVDGAAFLSRHQQGIAELSSPTAIGLAREAAAVYSIFVLANVDPRVCGRNFT